MKHIHNKSWDEKYPKTLLIHNHEGGMIWQVYNVNNKSEAIQIANNANRNGFMWIRLVDFKPTTEQTWSNWRETPGGQKIINTKIK